MPDYKEILLAMKLILDFLKLWDKRDRKSKKSQSTKHSKKK